MAGGKQRESDSMKEEKKYIYISEKEESRHPPPKFPPAPFLLGGLVVCLFF